MKISLLEPLGVSEELIRELSAPILERGHEFTYYPTKTIDPEELKRRSAGCEVVMIANNPYPSDVVRSADQLKMLNVAFTGIDHVGLDACREKGVAVCNAANYSNETVAELVIGMTIHLLRKITEAERAVRSGGTSAGLAGREIAGRTVGIIGTGRIGMITARLFQAFGAKVIAYSRTVKPEAEALGIEYKSLEEVMRESEIISLHTPNNASTHGMISRELISLMKPTAVFINCARGPIIDDQALADALNEGRIAGAGVDVFNVEPPLKDDQPLLHAKNCLVTPHVAFLSEEAMIRRAHIAFQNTLAYLDGKPENVCAL
ncbi:MAG: hydroxyacid dehydrogenase [Clostridia bacterium]|nr:hydroxyacid dehydrogenase [Clostridia bacterium]